MPEESNLSRLIRQTSGDQQLARDLQIVMTAMTLAMGGSVTLSAADLESAYNSYDLESEVNPEYNMLIIKAVEK